MYSVKEIFYSLQGEGARSGRAAVFCRFTGCNAWNGLEKDKATSACPFCDTNFVGVNGQGGGKYSCDELAHKLAQYWPNKTKIKSNNEHSKPYIVFTGGEPLLQLDNELIDAMHEKGFEIAVETNGSLPVPDNIDWLCVSPKLGMGLEVTNGNELKLLYPQEYLQPEQFIDLNFEQFFLQAIDSDELLENQTQTMNYCLQHPQWSYSFQLHKLLNID